MACRRVHESLSPLRSEDRCELWNVEEKDQALFNVAPLFNLYAETTSLNHIDYYGLGPSTLPRGKRRMA